MEGLMNRFLMNMPRLICRYPPTFVQTDNAEDAFKILQDGNIDLVISMLSLKGTDVFALAKRIKDKI